MAELAEHVAAKIAEMERYLSRTGGHVELVDELVAAALGEVRIAPAEAPQVVHVVVELEVALHVAPRGRARGHGVLIQHGCLLHCQERTCAELLARDRGVLDRHEVRMRTQRALRGEPQHLRPERGEHPGHLDLRSDVRSGIHRVEVAAHVLEWTRVGLSTRLDGWRVTHAKPKQEATGIRVDQRARSVRHGHGVARPDVGDAGRDDELRRCAEQEARVRERLLTAEAFRYPERSEPERLKRAHVVARARSRHSLDIVRPYADRSEALGPPACRLGHRAKRTRGAFARSNSLIRSGPRARSFSRAAVASAMSAATSMVWQLGANGRRRSRPSSRSTDAPWKFPRRQ